MRASWARRGGGRQQTTLATRYDMVRRRLAGEALASIGKALNVSPATVLNWTNRFLTTLFGVSVVAMPTFKGPDAHCIAG